MPVLAIAAILFVLCIWANDAWGVFRGLPTPVLIVAFVFWFCMSAFFLWLSAPTKSGHGGNAQSGGDAGGYFADTDAGGDGGD